MFRAFRTCSSFFLTGSATYDELGNLLGTFCVNEGFISCAIDSRLRARKEGQPFNDLCEAWHGYGRSEKQRTVEFGAQGLGGEVKRFQVALLHAKAQSNPDAIQGGQGNLQLDDLRALV